MADIGDLEETIRVTPEPLPASIPIPDKEPSPPVEVEAPDEVLVPA